jgi:hypothetical protein
MPPQTRRKERQAAVPVDLWTIRASAEPLRFAPCATQSEERLNFAHNATGTPTPKFIYGFEEK